VIADPELTGGSSPAPAPAQPRPPSNAGEDFGWGPVYEEPTPSASEPDDDFPPPSSESDSFESDYDPLDNTGLVRLEMLGQFAADLRHEGDLEDAYETRFRFGGEVELRRSRRLRVMVGSRIDFFWGVPSQNDYVLKERNERALDQDRF